MRFPMLLALVGASLGAQGWAPGRRVLLDAHNCYPEKGLWADRLDRALAQGLPIAVEQDLLWHNGRSILSHDSNPSGGEPGMREYFFERVRPLVEGALRSGGRRRWPLIVLNLDFKSDEPQHHHVVWDLLGEYESWLTTAHKGGAGMERLDVRPILVLTGASDVQERTFHDAVPNGGKLRVFGAVPLRTGVTAATPAGEILSGAPSNYRRWWNNPWSIVETGGQVQAGDWTATDGRRLKALVRHGHRWDCGFASTP